MTGDAIVGGISLVNNMIAVANGGYLNVIGADGQWNDENAVNRLRLTLI